MFEWLRESTWGYPIVGAIHVLGLAWFGAAVLIVDRQLRAWKGIGLAIMLATGTLLFALQPARYYTGVSFRIKMLLLLFLGVNAAIARTRIGLPRSLVLALWVCVIFASRAIAFF
ncbi:MAG: hypothetical protein ABJA98_30210 [Acidobacteriota bacterium]